MTYVVVSPHGRPKAPPFSLSWYTARTHAHSHEHKHGLIEPTVLINTDASEPPRTLAMAGAPPQQASFRPSQAGREHKAPTVSSASPKNLRSTQPRPKKTSRLPSRVLTFATRRTSVHGEVAAYLWKKYAIIYQIFFIRGTSLCATHINWS
jgi:hypothetical protein